MTGVCVCVCVICRYRVGGGNWRVSRHCDGYDPARHSARHSSKVSPTST